MPAFNQAAREAEAGGSSESQGSLVSTASSRAGRETSSGEQRTKPKPRCPKGGRTFPPKRVPRSGSSSHRDRRSARPTSPRAAGQGLWRSPAGRTADSGEASSSAHCQGRREERGGVRATRLPGTIMAGQHPRAATSAAKPQQLGCCRRRLSGAPPRQTATGAEAQSPFFPQAPSSARPCPPHLRKSERPVGQEMTPNRRRRSPAAAATNTDKMASAPSPHNLLRWI